MHYEISSNTKDELKQCFDICQKILVENVTIITTQQKIFYVDFVIFSGWFLAAESKFGVLFLLLSVFFKIFTILYISFSKYLISQIFLLASITTFEPETPASHSKYQKTRIVA